MTKDPKGMFKEASRAWEKGLSKKAFELFLAAAELGDDGAQLNLGHFYETGEAVRKDVRRALYWYKRAWRNGRQTSACCNIADLYAQAGKDRQARFWWRRAIAKGDGDAALDFAKYLIERGVRNDRRVFSLLKAAARSSRITLAGAREAKALILRLSSNRR